MKKWLIGQQHVNILPLFNPVTYAMATLKREWEYFLLVIVWAEE